MKKKILTVLILTLAALMIFTLAACGPKEENTDGDTPDNTVSTPTVRTEPITDLPSSNTSDETPLGSSIPTEFMDYAGANDDDNWKLPKYEFSSDVVTFICHYEVEHPKDDDFNAFRDIYNMTHKTVVTAPEEKLNKFISLVMSGDPPDIMIGEFMPALVNKGYLQPWDEYINFNGGIWDKIKTSIDTLKFKDHFYTIGVQPGRWDMCWYNIDLFEEYGVKTPKEYYLEGNWTWDTLRECAMALTVDLNGDGIPDVYGLRMDSIQALQFSAGKDFVSINPDGTISNNLKDPAIARAMQFYIDLVVRDKCVYQGGDGRDMFISENIAMIFGGAWYRSLFKETLILTDKVFFVPFPRDPSADKYYVYEGFGSESLAKGAPNPEGAAALLCSGRYDILNTNAKKEKSNDTILEEINWTKEMDEWLAVEFYSDDKYPVLSTWLTFGMDEYWGDLWYRTTQGEPWATIAEELYPRVQDNIERVIDLT